jgi:hypothetical protein
MLLRVMKVNNHRRIIFTVVAIGALALGARGQQPCPVDLPCGGIPRFAEYGNIRALDERAVLDNLAQQLRMSPDEIVYVLVYAGQEACLDEARLRALRIKNYLVKKHAIATGRIVWKDGGFKADLSTELWLLPRTSSLPPASPQLDHANRLLGRCKLPALGSR